MTSIGKSAVSLDINYNFVAISGILLYATFYSVKQIYVIRSEVRFNYVHNLLLLHTPNSSKFLLCTLDSFSTT